MKVEYIFIFFGIWILISYIQKSLFKKIRIGKMLILILIIYFNIYFLKGTVGVLSSLLIIFALTFFLVQIITIINNNRESKLLNSYVDRLSNLLLLKMNSGVAFRTSLQQVLIESDAFVQQTLIYNGRNVSFRTQKRGIIENKKLVFFKKILNECNSKEHLAFDLLKRFRKDQFLREKLIQKKKIVTHQSKSQAIIASFIYLILSVFMFFNFSWEKIVIPFSISVTFFVIGFIWTIKRGESVVWKI